MSKPVAVQQADFRSVVIDSDVPVLVDFWAEWCGPCKKLAPVLDDLSAEYGDRIRVVKVDVDAERGLASLYQIMSIPTVMIFHQGEKVAEFTGTRSKAELAQRIEEYL